MPSLSAFFDSPSALTVTGRKVSFRIVRNEGARKVVDASALLTFVDEKDRAQAHHDADSAINARYKGEPIPQDAREDERALHVLFRSLRDVDPPNAAFARTVDELRGALVERTLGDLWAEYNRYLAEEFPPYVDPDEFAKLVEAAKKKPLPGLLPDFDSVFIRRSLPSLAVLLLPSGTPK